MDDLRLATSTLQVSSQKQQSSTVAASVTCNNDGQQQQQGHPPIRDSQEPPPNKTAADSPSISVSYNDDCSTTNLRILCDLGYGLPKENRSRKEKILAISKQLVNFLWWQQEQHEQEQHAIVFHPSHVQPVSTIHTPHPLAELEIIDCPDEATQQALQTRMEQLWLQENNNNKQQGRPTVPFPSRTMLRFWNQSLQALSPPPVHANSNSSRNDLTEHLDKNNNNDKNDRHQYQDHADQLNHENQTNTVISSSSSTNCAPPPSSSSPHPVYLSPDASQALDPSKPPPSVVVVGLLIDRRIQRNRSQERAHRLCLPSAQLPLSQAGLILVSEDEKDDAADDKKTNSHKQEPQRKDQGHSFRFHSSEPLNVDCVLELLQQWHWNYCSSSSTRMAGGAAESSSRSPNRTKADQSMTTTTKATTRSSSSLSFAESCCFNAIHQALQHHAQRHPSRIQHQ